jgi:uncharacterized protein (TIGR00369 family)
MMVVTKDLERLTNLVTTGKGFTSSIGTRIVSVEPGMVCLSVAKRPDLLQFTGQFHGGVIAGLADHAAGAAVSTLLAADGRIAVTVDLHVNYLAAANGDTLLAKGRALKVGGTIGVAQVEVMSVEGGEEQLCAVATGTMRAIDMPTPPP